jgi:predicted RNA-binding protein Jag
MVSLEQFRERMALLSGEDKERKSIQVSGETLEEALKEAGTELGVKPRFLDFEILDKGKKNILGKGRNCLIIAYVREKVVGDDGLLHDMNNSGGIQTPIEEIKPADGTFTLRLARDGAYLKVKPPTNGGNPVVKSEILERAASRGVRITHKDLLEKAVQMGDNIFVKIGEYDYNPINDTMLTVSIEENDMKVYITAIPPGPGGSDYGMDDLRVFLKTTVLYTVL